MQCVQIIPTALAAEPLGYISLQQPLQKIFELCSERVWQLHILRVKQRGRKGRRKGRGGNENEMFELSSELCSEHFA